MTAHTPALIKDVSFTGNMLRMPYDQSLEAFGVDNVGWKVLTDTVFPSARSFEAIIMALTYCRRRNLDVFKRPVHIVPMWSKEKRAYIETVWPAIAELRTTATRTGSYAGCDEAEFGEPFTQAFRGEVNRENIEREVTYPDWCRINVYRMVNGERCKFVGPKVYWLESYGRVGNTAVPNDMWCKRPWGQIEKCAEAASLRRAFPEEIGNELSAEEMEGQVASGEIGGYEVPKVIEHREEPPPPPKQPKVSREEPPPPPKQRREEPPPPPKQPAAKQQSDDGSDPVGDAMQQGYDDAKAFPDLLRDSVPPDLRRDKELAAAWQNGFDHARTINEPPEDPSFDAAVLEAFAMRAADARDDDDLALAWSDLVQPNFRKLEKVAQQKAHEMYQNRRAALRGG